MFPEPHLDERLVDFLDEFAREHDLNPESEWTPDLTALFKAEWKVQHEGDVICAIDIILNLPGRLN